MTTMADISLRILGTLFIMLQICPLDVSGWERIQAWSFATDRECKRYYANLTIQEGFWCPAMWDGLLCWPPAPHNKIVFLPCPPNGNQIRSRIAYKRCTPEGIWEDVDVNSSSGEERRGTPTSLEQRQAEHTCFQPQQPQQQQEQEQQQEETKVEQGTVREEPRTPHPRIRSKPFVKVSSKIEQRYAQTVIAATMRNPNPQPSELKFKMTFPETAYITSLVMEVDGTNHTSNVRRKSLASRAYQLEKIRGGDAVIVTQSGLQEFEISAHLVSSEVTFYLSYEELLRRTNGDYVQKIHIQPGYRIPAAEVSVHIIEREPIKDYRILELPGQELSGNPGAQVSESLINDGEVRVNYKHSEPLKGKGVDGTFTIAYNLQSHSDGGEVERMGDYFTHFLSLDESERLPRIPKHTVFALDVSSSMGEGKLSPVKAAMKTILESLNPDDSFEILAFSSDVASLGVFNGTNIRKALRRVKRLQPIGYSNLQEAYLQALKSAEAFKESSLIVKQIVMITDGKPTQGLLDPVSLRRDIEEANRLQYPIYGIGLGNLDDFSVIRHISTDSQGFAKHYSSKKTLEKSILEFVKEISVPILTNVGITYPENEVDPESVVKLGSSHFYAGGEVVAVGKILPGVQGVHPWVTGEGKIGSVQLQMDRMNSQQMSRHGNVAKSPVERLWAFLTVQNLLSQAEMNDNLVRVKELLDQATQLALNYGFVTPVTSLVVRDATREFDVVCPETEFQQQLPVSPFHGPSDLQADAPQPPKNANYKPKAQMYVDFDPHFVVLPNGMNIPICFDVHAHHGANLNLIRDKASGIIVNAEVVGSAERPKLTYIDKVFLALGKVNLTVTTESVEVDCVGDDGSLQIDRVTRTLWPFYKKNGKKYKKRMANRLNRITPSDDRNSVLARVSRQSRRHFMRNNEDSTYFRRNYPDDSRSVPSDFRTYTVGSLLPEDQPDIMHYVMNSNVDDYIPHRHFRPQSFPRKDASSRMLRHSRHPLASRKEHKKKRKDARNDRELCNARLMWEDGVAMKYGNVLVLMNRKKNLQVTIGDGQATFKVFRSQKGGQLFLGFYLQEENIISQHVHGILGQFMAKNITVSDSTPILTSAVNSPIDLIVTKRNHRDQFRTSQVSGFTSKRRSMLDRDHVMCVEVRQPGKGLLDGRLQDYLMPCLQC